MHVSEGSFQGSASGDAVEHFAELMLAREKTKRLLIASVTLLVICACAAMLFAPAGREQMSYLIGGVLFVLALGAIGASRFILKVPGASVNTFGEPVLPKARRGRRTGGSDAHTPAE